MCVDALIKELSESFRLALEMGQYELATDINNKINQIIHHYKGIKV